MSNREFSKSADFVALCEAHNVKPTIRQASKWRRRTGLLRSRARAPRGLPTAAKG